MDMGGHIDFQDGHEFTFVSQRSFPTHREAEEYLRQFVRARIDNRLRAGSIRCSPRVLQLSVTLGRILW
jgi:hypothetical protein